LGFEERTVLGLPTNKEIRLVKVDDDLTEKAKLNFSVELCKLVLPGLTPSGPSLQDGGNGKMLSLREGSSIAIQQGTLGFPEPEYTVREAFYAESKGFKSCTQCLGTERVANTRDA